MNRAEFVKAVATATNKTQKETKELVDAMAQIIVDQLKAREEVKVFDGITFDTKDVEARERRNPFTGETFMADAKVKPVCKFGKSVKEYLN
ncbi:MAG: HU family DNA-binding protein [Firmicutes bacterium]|nr:HU family DNA-binding protein [Candidatus Colivicinus equi]